MNTTAPSITKGKDTLSTFERGIAMFSGVVSVIGFLFSVADRLDIYSPLSPSYKSPQTAIALLISFCILSSYGTSVIIHRVKLKDRSIFLLWSILTIAYCLTTWQLLETYIPPDLKFPSGSSYRSVCAGMSGVINILITWKVYVLPIGGPRTFSIFPSERFAKAWAFGSIHVMYVAILLVLLQPTAH